MSIRQILSSPSSPSTLLIAQELIDDSRYHPNLGGVTRGGIANHYPMTLLALQGLGASEQEVLSFKQTWPRYRALIEADLGLMDTGTVQTHNWKNYLGQAQYLREFRRVFLALLNQDNLSNVMSQALDAMKEGLPMGLFHPLIRLSFAHSHQDKGQIADALAYMAIRHQDLYHGLAAQTASHETTVSAQEVWQQIARELDEAAFELPLRRGSLSICEQLCSDPRLQSLAFPAGFALSAAHLPQQIQQICLLALRLYLYQPALTTLHAVTAAQGLAELQATHSGEVYLHLWQRYWVWLTALYVEKGHPLSLAEIDPDYLPEIKAAGWDILTAQARTLPEVHLIKLTYSCQWLAERAEPSAQHFYKLAVINMLREQQAHPRLRYGLVKAGGF